MFVKDLISAEQAVPRYTSYPTAPHFGPAVGANAYASWLEDLSKSKTLSLYLHVPFCEQLCLYCGCHTKAVRQPEPVEAYAERLTQEIELVAARTGCRRVVHLHWGGGTPSILGPKRLREIVAQLDVCFDLTELCEHAIELDPRHVTKALAGALADIGVSRVSLGVQDFAPHVQQTIGRIQPFATVERAVGVLRDVGIDQINIDLMYGLPNQSVQDVRRTVMLAHELKPQRLAVFGYAHVPWFKTHQRLIDEASLPKPAARIAQAETAHEILTTLGYEPIGLDHYASPRDNLTTAARAGRLHRNFQGYTTDDADALVGIGTSAIGRLPQGLVQNISDTGNYSRAVGSGHLATARGIAFSDEDRLRGRIIEELMCNLACDLDQVASELCDRGSNSFEREIEALAPYVVEGLVDIDGSHVRVNEEGRPYLRLIAAAFDAYLPESRARHSVAV